MYILALKHVRINLDGSSYTEMRKLIDVSMKGNFKYVIYTALLSNLVLVICTFKNPGSRVFITAAIAFAALILDTIIAIKGNIPINDTINTWTPDTYPANWAEFRTKWLQIFQYQQIANITGFVSLLIGAVFGSK